MVITIKKGDSMEAIKKKLSRLPRKKPKRLTNRKLSNKKKPTGFPAHLFTGKVKFEGDPVEIQRKMRDEWG